MTDVLTEANNIISSELPTITIAKSEHELLMFGARILAALKAQGVEDWEGFNKAIGSISE